MCKKDPVISLIDIHSTLCNQEGNANRSLFDNNDPSGVHINNEGVNKLIGQLYLYMSSVFISLSLSLMQEMIRIDTYFLIKS